MRAMPPGLKDEHKLEAVLSYSDREPETTVVSLSGMIRFVETTIFFGVQQPFLYVRRLPPEDSVVKVQAGMIRFVKTAIFSEVQQLFFVRRAITSGTFNP